MFFETVLSCDSPVFYEIQHNTDRGEKSRLTNLILEECVLNVFETVNYGVNCREAAQRLAADFGINADRPPTQAVLEKRRQKSEAQQLTENERLCFSVLSEYTRLLRD